MSLRRATVVEVLESRTDLQKVRVRIESVRCVDDTGRIDDAKGTEDADTSESVDVTDSTDSTESTEDTTWDILAYNYLALGSALIEDQQVLVNTTGIDLKLGTGGVGFIVPGAVHEDTQTYGHVVKLRYTPLQLPVDSVEEQESPSHELLKVARNLNGMPVVCCELHSQMPLVAAAIKQEAPKAHIAYIMNDAAALPLALSELVYKAKEAGLLDCTITCGQAFGGDLEAVNTYTALLTARLVCGADIAIVAPGPGVVGSGTTFGHSGIAQGEALNAVASLKGLPIAVLRLSWQDARERHKGLSHHTATVLSQVCLAPVLAPAPDSLSAERLEALMQQLNALGHTKGHEFPLVTLPQRAIDLRGIEVRTMGRSQEDDPEFFDAAFVAGLYAARL